MTRSTSGAGSGASAFQQLQTLVGDWSGPRPDGRPVGVSYRMSANGSALVETWTLAPGQESLTIYHMDKRDLVATHFCPVGNQPRLVMTRAAGSRFDFTVRDGTGIEPGASFQHDFWIEIGADGRITRSETYVQGDGTEEETITYSR